MLIDGEFSCLASVKLVREEKFRDKKTEYDHVYIC